MRESWKLPPERDLPLGEWEEADVILEFNGPQLATVVRDGALYLSVASDSDERATRWLRSRISKMESEALLQGATTVRECIVKDEILVVDTDDDGRVIAEVLVHPAALSDDDLPSTKSFLPKEVVASHQRLLRKPAFFLDGPEITDHSVGFRVLADVVEQIQRLWNAIGQTILGAATHKGSVPAQVQKEAELRLVGIAEGSAGLEISTSSDAMFGKIAERYGDLLFAAGDQEAIQSLLQSSKRRVRSAFLDYLTVIQKHDVEVLTKWDGHAAFVSPFTARRLASNIEGIAGSEEEQVTAVGYFIGFHLEDATFEFQDSSDDEGKYEGRVMPQVLARKDLNIVVGQAATYEVALVVVSWSRIGAAVKQAVILQNLRQISGPTRSR